MDKNLIQWECGQCKREFEVEKWDDIVGDRPDHSTAEEGKDGVQYCSKECRAKAMFADAPEKLREGLKELADAVSKLNDLYRSDEVMDHLETFNIEALVREDENGDKHFLSLGNFLRYADILQRELGGEHDYPEWAR